MARYACPHAFRMELRGLGRKTEEELPAGVIPPDNRLGRILEMCMKLRQLVAKLETKKAAKAGKGLSRRRELTGKELAAMSDSEYLSKICLGELQNSFQVVGQGEVDRSKALKLLKLSDEEYNHYLKYGVTWEGEL